MDHSILTLYRAFLSGWKVDHIDYIRDAISITVCHISLHRLANEDHAQFWQRCVLDPVGSQLIKAAFLTPRERE